MQKKTDIAVVGAFRSGTNYARAVLESNFNAVAHYNTFGWKHGFVPVFAPGCEIPFPRMRGVFMTKDPYSFLTSFFKFHSSGPNATVGGEGWKDFLRARITVFNGKRGSSVELRFANPVEYWNSLNWNFWSAAERGRLVHLRYEAALEQPLEEFQHVATELGLTRITDEFDVPSGNMKRMADSQKARSGGYEATDAQGRTFEFKSERYTEKQYLEAYSEADLDFVAGQLDPELCRCLGYDRVAQRAPVV